LILHHINVLYLSEEPKYQRENNVSVAGNNESKTGLI
jgi:hypothetical protein